MKYAIVVEGKVENLVEWDGKDTFRPDGDLVEVDEQPVDIGWLYADGEFSKPDTSD